MLKSQSWATIWMVYAVHCDICVLNGVQKENIEFLILFNHASMVGKWMVFNREK